MGTAPILLGVVVFPLWVFVLLGGPAVLMDWIWKWRAEATRRQIALTDAIDARLGPMVAPVVKHPLWGPWRVQIAVPFSRPAAVGNILVVAKEVLTVTEGMNTDRYEIIVTPKLEAGGERRETRSQSPMGWSRETRVAA